MNTANTFRLIWCAGLLLLSIGLAGCGPDLVGAAAVGAATKKTELEQGQKAQQEVNDQLQKALGQVQQRNEQLEKEQLNR